MGLWSFEVNVVNVLAGVVIVLALLALVIKSKSELFQILASLVLFAFLVVVLLVNTPFEPLESPIYLLISLAVLGFLFYINFKRVSQYFKKAQG